MKESFSKTRGHWEDNSGDINAAVQAAWESIPDELINKLVGDFRRRLELVVEMKGESISGLLSSHMDHPKPGMIVEHDWSLFSEEEDQILMDLHEQYGNQWTRIGRELPDPREKNLVKNRITAPNMRKVNERHKNHQEFPLVGDAMFDLEGLPGPGDLDAWLTTF